MRRKDKFPMWFDLLLLLGVFLVVTVFCGVLLSMLITTGNISRGFGMFLLYALQFGIVGTFAIIQRKRNLPKGEPLLKFGFRNIDIGIILWGFCMMIAAGVIIEPLLMLLPERYLEPLKDMMNMGWWAMLTMIVLAPVLEEILFRGILQESITYKYGSVRGIIIASAVFAAMHTIPQQVINAFFIGMILGYIYYLTQSIITVIILHGLNNVMAFLIGLFNKDAFTTRALITNDAVYWVIYILCVVIVVVSALRITFAARKMNVAASTDPDSDGPKVKTDENN